MLISNDIATDLTMIVIFLLGLLGALFTIFVLVLGTCEYALIIMTSIILRKKNKDKPP